MSFRCEMRLSGEGGQGLVLAGKILAEAAAIYQGINATQSQSYGPEARGGASRSEIILSDEDIDYPKAVRLDLLLALTQEACDRYVVDLKPSGVLLVDSDAVKKVPEGPFRTYRAPVIRGARETIGREIVANIVALGIITRIADVIDEESVREAILTRVPKGTEEINLKAFELGLSMADRLIAEEAGKPGAN
ncbi:MAG: 2-oxoacid:acceptor oxidoreductase family protein [Candidatus Eisenbacteria bacterium]|nr:2-oxoacid:acceptor oxidoreductase family protein [Candidatus Eisenbacteria bacterium]